VRGIKAVVSDTQEAVEESGVDPAYAHSRRSQATQRVTQTLPRYGEIAYIAYARATQEHSLKNVLLNTTRICHRLQVALISRDAST
jgi:hypothetical protein